jgi:hypothetical protein
MDTGGELSAEEKRDLLIHNWDEGCLKSLNPAARENMLAVVNAQVTAAMSVKDADMSAIVRQTRFVFDFIQAIAPADAIEVLLAGEIIATHFQIMERLRCKGSDEQIREATNQGARLQRNLCKLIEGFDRHRGKGPQRITVKHVHVNEGGQAIVGNVNSTTAAGPRMTGEIN